MERLASARDLERLERWLIEHPAGCSRLLFTDDVLAATSVLTERAQDTGVVLVCVFVDPIPRDRLTFRMVEALADGARARWPVWYGREFGHAGTFEDELAAPIEVARVIEEHGEVLSRWLADACAQVRAGGRPFFADRPLGPQARQLALAIDADMLRVVVVWPRAHDHATLDGLARALDWVAGETGARITGVLDAELDGRDVLDRISYGATRLRFAMADTGGAANARAAAAVYPVIGRPHPLSQVEQRLAQVLAQAEDLRPLFEFNQRITTARGTQAVVDLIWRAGRVIVEIDGWETHGNRGAFASDRHRDYELVVSGFLVLRLTNDEILHDAAKAVDKIRDVVAFRHSERGTR